MPAEQWPDIYVISFFVSDEDDDPQRPTLTVGFNTISNWQRQVAHASSIQEAKWNYAFWLQNQLAVLGESGTESAEWVQRWVRDLDLAYTDEDEEEDFDRCIEFGQAITRRFVEECCEFAATLHRSGFVRGLCGRTIPILVHGLEYYDEIADQNERANPSGEADEFIAWVRAGCP